MFGHFPPLDRAIVTRCYNNFLAKGVNKPDPSAKEVPRKTAGTVHHYFDEMFKAVVETLEKEPLLVDSIRKLRMGYEEPLAPSKHIPAYHVRSIYEATASLVSTLLIIEIKQKTRPSSSGKDLIEESWSDTVGYTNAVLSHLLGEVGPDTPLEEILQFSAVGLALTPDDVTVTKAFLVSSGRGRFDLKQTSIYPPPLRLHDDSGCGPGVGFTMLVNAIAACTTMACKPRQLVKSVTLAYAGDLALSRRVGRGGSSDTYEAEDGTAVKVRHTDTVASLVCGGVLLELLQDRAAPDGCAHIPMALSMAPSYLQITPCGVPLYLLISRLFAHQKICSLADNPDAVGFRTTARETVPTRPVGLLYLGYMVLAHVSEALKLAHRQVGGEGAVFVHTDLRISNVVVALRQGTQWVAVPEIPVDREEGAAAPLLNTALLVEWGNALMIGTATPQPPGNVQSAADAVLHSRDTGDGSWVPHPRHDRESLAYLYWSITHHVLGECPWAPSAVQQLTTHREPLLSSATDPVLVSVRAMVQSARADSTDLLQHVDMDALRADYQAMVADPTIPFQLPNLLPTG